MLPSCPLGPLLSPSWPSVGLELKASLLFWQDSTLVNTIDNCVRGLLQAWNHWSIQILDVFPLLRVRNCSPDSLGYRGGAPPVSTLQLTPLPAPVPPQSRPLEAETFPRE